MEELDTITDVSHPRLDVKISRKDKSLESLAEDVLAGLSATPKSLPPKYFYDATGSKLFEQICDLPEYYLTRTERDILERYAREIAECFEDDVTLVELGSGNSSKTRLLIEAFIKRFEWLHYLPVDISKSILLETAEDLVRAYPRLKITALVADYHTALDSLKGAEVGHKLILFLGSNIGNFEPDEAAHFLERTRASMNPEDRMLIGADLMKAPEVLIPAYDDARGVTARFNLNLLHRINSELGGDFNLDRFRHTIVLNREHGRIEMHLKSTARQAVTLARLRRRFQFERGETIHTENSYKFTLDGFRELVRRADLDIQTTWLDERRWFSVHLLRPAS